MNYDLFIALHLTLDDPFKLTENIIFCAPPESEISDVYVDKIKVLKVLLQIVHAHLYTFFHLNYNNNSF